MITVREKIYCNGGPGSLLHSVQMENIFSDSKTFVDMKMICEPETVLRNWEELIARCAPVYPDKESVSEFVSQHFTTETELVECVPHDWQEDPNFQVAGQARVLCYTLNNLWRQLGRRVSRTVLDNQEKFSLLFLPNPVVVPGGRFREIYYWDSLWIIKGLLACGMKDTARGMVENLLYLVNKLGYVPNGGRIYYTRSQPPLLSSMVNAYYEATGDDMWATSQVDLLEKEWLYWEKAHSVKVKGRRMFRYNCEEGKPRPESYREDFLLAEKLKQEEKEELWKELRTGAESGWDYSSRWYGKEGEGVGLEDTKIRTVLPVDLNAFLARGAGIIAKLYGILNKDEEVKSWKLKEMELVKAIEDLMWCEVEGVWLDLDMITGCKRSRFSASNFVPLWAGAVPENKKAERGERCTEYLMKMVGNQKGGLPTTMVRSGQQWDYPNVWPPLEHMVIMGLYNSGGETAREQARKMAKLRVEHCIKIMEKTGFMFEKYHCEDGSQAGGGGEYEVQVGFGWTNGSLLDIITSMDCFSSDY